MNSFSHIHYGHFNAHDSHRRPQIPEHIYIYIYVCTYIYIYIYIINVIYIYIYIYNTNNDNNNNNNDEFTSTGPLKVEISQGLGPLSRIELLKAGHNLQEVRFSQIH